MTLSEYLQIKSELKTELKKAILKTMKDMGPDLQSVAWFAMNSNQGSPSKTKAA